MLIHLKDKIFGNSMYRNSMYIMASTLIMSVLGFLFWTFCTRFFTKEEIGLTTGIFSAGALLTSFSMLGQNNSLIKFLPSSNNKNKIFTTSFILTSLVAIIVTLIYIFGIRYFSPELFFIKNNLIIFISFLIYVVISVVSNIMDAVFIAYKRAEFVFVRATLFSVSKLILPLILMGFSFYTIYFSTLLGLALSVLFSLIFLYKVFSYNAHPELDIDYIRASAKFSLGNYVASFFGMLPSNGLNLLIVNALGASSSAIFYMCLMVVALIHIIPKAIAQSMFAESSYENFPLRTAVKKALVLIFLLVSAPILISVLFGNYVLLIFGADYVAEGFKVLQILSISAIFVSINYIGDTLLNIKHRIKEFVFMNFFNASLVLSLSYLLLGLGLMGVAYAWFLGQVITCLLYLLLIYTLFLRKKT